MFGSKNTNFVAEFINISKDKEIAELAVELVNADAKAGRDILTRAALVAKYRHIEMKLQTADLSEEFAGLNSN